MQRPQLACCLPAPGVSRLSCEAFQHLLRAGEKGSPLTLCFEAVMNPEAVPTDLPVSGLLLLCWIPWKQDTAGWELLHSHVTFLLFQLPAETRFVLSVSNFIAEELGLILLPLFFLSRWLHQSGDQYSQAYPFCSCPLHNIGLLLLFPARILRQLSEMDMQPLYCAKPPRKNSF